MEKRVLRPRNHDKETEIAQLQPAKRNRRAMSTIECSQQGKKVPIVETILSTTSNHAKGIEIAQLQPAKRNRRAMTTIERSQQVKKVPPKIVSTTSTQTDNCLVATNAKLAAELIGQNNLMREKDRKYIEMLQQYFIEKERLTAENVRMRLEITQLRERIERMENEPLIDVENGMSNARK